MITKEEVHRALRAAEANPRDLTEVRMALIELRSKIRRASVPALVDLAAHGKSWQSLSDKLNEHAAEIIAIDVLIDALGEYTVPEPAPEPVQPALSCSDCGSTRLSGAPGDATCLACGKHNTSGTP